MRNVSELHWCSYVRDSVSEGAMMLAGSGSFNTLEFFQLLRQTVAEYLISIVKVC